MKWTLIASRIYNNGNNSGFNIQCFVGGEEIEVNLRRELDSRVNDKADELTKRLHEDPNLQAIEGSVEI